MPWSCPCVRGIEKPEQIQMGEHIDDSSIWTLTVLRHGEDGSEDDIEKAEFRFGRWADELEESPITRLPSGLVSVLQRSEILEEAMETGFVVQMLPQTCSEPGWNDFIGAAKLTHLMVGPFGPTRGMFVCQNDYSTLEFVDVCCPFHSESDGLPQVISIRVLELPLATVAWAFDNGIFECDSEQLTLDQWVEFSEIPSEDDKQFPMPGPPEEKYTFLQ